MRESGSAYGGTRCYAFLSPCRTGHQARNLHPQGDTAPTDAVHLLLGRRKQLLEHLFQKNFIRNVPRAGGVPREDGEDDIVRALQHHQPLFLEDLSAHKANHKENT